MSLKLQKKHNTDIVDFFLLSNSKNNPNRYSGTFGGDVLQKYIK